MPLSGPASLDTATGELGYLEEMDPPLNMGELTLIVWTQESCLCFLPEGVAPIAWISKLSYHRVHLLDLGMVHPDGLMVAVSMIYWSV